MRIALTGTALAVMLAVSVHAQQPAAVAGDQEPVARLGDRVITARDLDERWKAASPVDRARLQQALYDARREALDAILADLLLNEAAKAKGVTREQFETTEVARRTQPVTDATIATFYAANRTQMQGRSLDEMRPILREFLQDQNAATARVELVSDLRNARADLRVMLEAPRQTIEIGPDDPSEGTSTAPVTLVEYSDFQCPFCRSLVPTLRQVRDKYGDRVRIVWKDFPLTQIHPQAFQSAEAGNCAREQGKFWEYHDRLFANQQMLQSAALKEYASELKLDSAKFNACLDSSKYKQRIEASMATGMKIGVGSTPTVFVNGRTISGAKPFQTFVEIIDDELRRLTR